jgi:hypothetical protein
LCHVLEVFEEEATVVIGDASDLVPALIGVETQLELLGFDLRRLLRQHKVKGSLLVVHQLLLKLHLLHLIHETTPLGSVFELEKFFLFVEEGTISLDIGLVSLLTVREQVAEGTRLV